MKMNKIYNMDCLEGLKQIKDNSIDLIVTDPPYKITSRGNSGNSGGMFKKTINKNGNVFKYNSIKIEEWLPLLYNKLKFGKHIYIMTNNLNITNYLNEINKSKFKFIKCLIWNKTNKIMGCYYMNQYEYIIFARKGKGNKINNCKTSDIITIENKKIKLNNENLHDSQKPVKLFEIMINNSSNENDIILDPFIGIGTTAIACIKNNRKYIGFEIDKHYYKISEKRLNLVNNQETLNEWF